MARTYRLTLPRRAANAWVKVMTRAGLVPRRINLLSVPGRSSGRVYTTPVNLVEREGQLYLVAPYGEVSWVRNARAAGEVSLRRGRERKTMRIEPVEPSEAAPVLREYMKQNVITRPFFDVELDAPESEFVAEAPRHPVFRLV